MQLCTSSCSKYGHKLLSYLATQCHVYFDQETFLKEIQTNPRNHCTDVELDKSWHSVNTDRPRQPRNAAPSRSSARKHVRRHLEFRCLPNCRATKAQTSQHGLASLYCSHSLSMVVDEVSE